ncbi:MAG TPA: sterol desaturase family protein [Acidimicrobiales bacterium]|nr:sterol desaturase family protein [Acidimicrobiales bacterium]
MAPSSPPATSSLSLRAAGRLFAAQVTPKIIALVLAGAAAARLAVGRWQWRDLVVPAVILAAQPFTEWLIHVLVLHFRPRQLGALRIDPYVARKHRAHHADPRDLPLVFVPLPDLVLLIGGMAAISFVVLPLPQALTAMVAAYAVLGVYEWTHFLIHSTYRPRRRLYRSVWRAHRNHHFRNEHYWFGVTMHLADHLLGTFPDKSAVEVSPTARTLGVEAAT